MLNTEAIRRWTYELWRAAGSSEEEARITADHLIEANLSGHDSHGLSVVPGYVRSLLSDQLQLNQRISMVTDAGSLVVVDGNRGMGQSIAAQTMTLAIERARDHGVAIVGLRNSHHIGRVGHWAEQAMREGMASVHFTNVVSRPLVAPHGGTQARLGTNPLTVGLPRRGAAPILLDFATSAIAVGKIRVAYYKKVPAPEGVLLDAEGRPTTDPAVMYEEPLGALLAAAGHKGYALGLVCDLLGAALFGGNTPLPEHLRKNGMYNNMLVIVFDPARFGALDHYERETEAFVEYVRSSRRLPGAEEILVPGDAERKYRAARARALPIDAGTVSLLDEAAESINGLRGTRLGPASATAVS
ncbi:MAG: malate/lactate/ureidoglycolate dehydrogenase [Betaproteobacteria bacterium]|nr:MAG: malate/lactate/ureidoglycolate dehydrogenase [Betaproteobacteria bacterium]